MIKLTNMLQEIQISSGKIPFPIIKNIVIKYLNEDEQGQEIRNTYIGKSIKNSQNIDELLENLNNRHLYNILKYLVR